MTQQDMLFLAMIAIGLTSLTVIVVQLFRRRGSDDDRGEWYEGPWDDDGKK